MSYKKLFLVPLLLLIISLVSSFISFQYSKEMAKGYIYIQNSAQEIYIEGEYYAILGNLGLESATITLDSMDEGIHISVYDYSDILIKDYILVINELDQSYSKAIVSDYQSEEKIIIDDIEGNLFKVNLEENTRYELNLIKTLDNLDDEEIDIVLVNIVESTFNMQSITESIAFTTLVFSGLAFFTILAFIYIKKD